MLTVTIIHCSWFNDTCENCQTQEVIPDLTQDPGPVSSAESCYSILLYKETLKKASSYIAQYPALRTAQSALHFTSLTNLFIQTPSRLLWEASSHMLQLMREGCSYILYIHHCPHQGCCSQESDALPLYPLQMEDSHYKI